MATGPLAAQSGKQQPGWLFFVGFGHEGLNDLG
jgi:hypothetical protein